MTIKRKDFQKAAAFIHEFLLKLGPDTECAELRDSLNLSLLHMQDSPDKFQWRWIELDQAVRRKPSEILANGRLVSSTLQHADTITKCIGLPVVLRITKHGEDNRLLKLIEAEPKCLKERDQLGRTALMYAVHYGHLDTIQHILEQCIDIDATAVDCSTFNSPDGSSAVHRACYNGNYEALCLLVEYGCSCDLQDGQGRAPIHWACSNKDNNCLKILLERDVTTKCRDLEGLTPAMWACRQDHFAHFTMVNQYDRITIGDECSRDNNGKTWLHWSVRRTEPLQCLKSLLTLESALMRDDEGKSVVHIATEQGSIASLKAIVEVAGVECLEQRDKENRTPLHLATICGHGELVNYLLSVNVDLAVVDNWVQTAWDYARTRQLHYCMLIIASYIRQQNRISGYDLEKLQITNNEKNVFNTEIDIIHDHIPKPPYTLPLNSNYVTSSTRPSPLGQGNHRFMPTPPPEDLGIPLTPRGPPLSSRALDKGLKRGYAIKRCPTSPDDIPPLHHGAVHPPTPPQTTVHQEISTSTPFLHQQTHQHNHSIVSDDFRSTSKVSVGTKRMKSNDHESTEIAASLTSLEQSVHESAKDAINRNNTFFVVTEGDLNNISVDGMDVSDFDDQTVGSPSVITPTEGTNKKGVVSTASALISIEPILDPVRPLTPRERTPEHSLSSPLPGMNSYQEIRKKSLKTEEIIPSSPSPSYFNVHAQLSPIQGEHKKKKKKKSSHLTELSPMINTPPLTQTPPISLPSSQVSPLVAPLIPASFDDIPIPQKRTQLNSDSDVAASAALSLQPRPRKKQQQTSIHISEDFSEKFVKSAPQLVSPLAPPLQQAPPLPQAQPRQKRVSKKSSKSREKSKSSQGGSRSEDQIRKSSAISSSSRADKMMYNPMLSEDKMSKSIGSRVKGVTWAPPSSRL